MSESKHPVGARLASLAPPSYPATDVESPVLEPSAAQAAEALGIPDDLRRALREIERGARALPWISERPWLVSKDLRLADGAIVLDLHNLSESLALRAVTLAIANSVAWRLVLIHGRGARSRVGPVLQRAVRESITAAVAGGQLACPEFDEGRITVWVLSPGGWGRLVTP